MQTLELKVAVEGEKSKPAFVFLSGGPGEPGVPFIARARQWLGPAAKDVRIVAFDQRGTGEDALNCPALQKQMGASDLSPPTEAAVTECAAKLGDRRAFFTTKDTVDDLEALRIALGADKLTLDGISYGTYVAQRYALAHPRRVKALVLDSVVPAEGVSLLSETSIKATRRVLGPRDDQRAGEGHRARRQRPGAAGHAHGALGRRAAATTATWTRSARPRPATTPR